MADESKLINDLASTFKSALKAHRDGLDAVVDRLDSSRKGPFSNRSVRDLSRRQKMRELELERAKKGVKAAKEFDDALLELSAAMDGSADDMESATRHAVRSLDELMNSANTLDEAQRARIVQLRQEISQGQVNENMLKEALSWNDKVMDQEKVKYDKQAILVKQTDKLTRGMMGLQDAINKTMDEFFSLDKAIALFAGGISKEFDIIKYAMERQVAAMDILGQGLSNSAAMYGLSVEEVMKTQTEYRQAMLAAAGSVDNMSDVSAKAFKQYDKLSGEFFAVTGDRDKAFAAMASSMDALSFQGVKLSMDEMSSIITGPDGLRSQFQELALMTGKSVDELARMNARMMDDADMRLVLQGLDRRQRVAMVADLTNYQKLLVAKGMEAEQAAQAATALAKLTAQVSPKERYKQAVKLSVIGKAMGISGSENMIQAAMNPNAEGSKQIMQNFATQYQQRMGSMLGSGDLGTQLLGGAFGEKAGGELLSTILKSGTAGLEGRAPDERTVAAIEKLASEAKAPLTGLQDNAASILNVVQAIKNAMSDPIIELGGGTIAAVGSIFKEAVQLAIAASLLKGGGGLLGKMGGLGKIGALGKGGAALASGAGAALPWLGAGAVGLGSGFAIGTLLTDTLPKMMGAESGLGELIGQKLYELNNPEFAAAPAMKPAQKMSPPGTNQPGAQTTDEISKQYAETAQRLAMVDQTNKELVATLTQQLSLQKQALEAMRQNTDATKTNTEVTQTEDRFGKMSYMPPVPY